MEVLETELRDVKLIKVDRLTDERGCFAEIYDHDTFRRHGIPEQFVYEGWITSRKVGTVRGLHFQSPPHAQHKLVRVTRGEILCAVVDIRRGSPGFGRHATLRLSAHDPFIVFIPIGFADGFCTLEPDTEVEYKASDRYVPNLSRGINWADPALRISWPVAKEKAILSTRDWQQPRLSEIETQFLWGISV